MENQEGSRGLVRIGGSHAFDYFLDRLLNARIELRLETERHEGNHEDMNVYLAGLLQSLVQTGGEAYDKPYISAYDLDVRHYLEDHPGPANAYIVYKGNADFGLVSCGVFLGHEHKGSYFKRVMPEHDSSPRIASYYNLAASALVHIKGSRAMLVTTFYSIAEEITEIIEILRKVATDYFELIERMTPGSLFHLQKEIEERLKMEQYDRLLDEFLQGFAAFRISPTPEGKDRLLQQARRLKTLNGQFNYDGLLVKLKRPGRGNE
jgi:hypothetical protein